MIALYEAATVDPNSYNVWRFEKYCGGDGEDAGVPSPTPPVADSKCFKYSPEVYPKKEADEWVDEVKPPGTVPEYSPRDLPDAEPNPQPEVEVE